MMRLALAILMVSLAMPAAVTQPAAGRDPFNESPDREPRSPADSTFEPAPVAPPPGVYLVTETYAGDSVTRIGPITTYSTETTHQTTGSYARVLESVSTGASSGYDGTAFNGRASLTDGRAVAGTYYENYVRTDGGFVPVSVVFFQDDLEIARASRAAQRRPAGPAAAAVPPAAPPPAVLADPRATGGIGPVVERADPSPIAPGLIPLREPKPLSDRSIEVLRGRRTSISLSGQGVRTWRLLSGEGVALGALAGTVDDPFVARWDRLPSPGATWVVRFVVDRVDGTSGELVVLVAVRAPGLVE
jgi:hypothetical protein